jgi:hypothetical protein
LFLQPASVFVKISALTCCLAAGLFLLAPSRLASANLVTNGDFETGDFTAWTVTHAATGSGIGVNFGFGPDSTQGAFFGATGHDFDAISQSFATSPGAFYTLTFFYQVLTPPSGSPDNHFRALFDGNVVYDNLNAISGFGTFTFHVQATGSLTTLEFEGYNVPGLDFLDDVSVTPGVPDASSSVLLLGLALAAILLVRPMLFA